MSVRASSGAGRLTPGGSTIARLPFFYGWAIVYAAGSTMFVRNAAASLTLGVFLFPMSEGLGWSRTLIAGATGAAGLATIFITPVTGWMVDRYGPRMVLGGAILVLGFSTISLRWAAVPVAFYFAYGAGRIVFNSHVQIGAATVVSHWFVRRRGRAMAILGVVHATGMGLFPLLAQLLINGTGDWRMAWFWLGFVVWGVALAPVWLLIIRRPEDVGLEPDGGGSDRSAGPPAEVAHPAARGAAWTLRGATRSRTLWMLALAGGMTFFVVAGTNVHQTAFLRDRGVSATGAAGAIALLAAGTAAGSLLWGLLSERFPVRLVYVAITVWLAAVALLYLTVNSLSSALAVAALFGAGLGGLLVVPPLIIADYFGREALGSIRGVMEPFVGVGQALGAVGAGVVYDMAGSYTIAFTMFAAVAGGTGLLLLATRRPRAASLERPAIARPAQGG